jgi:hypothetical protein
MHRLATFHVPQPPHDDPFGPPLCLHSPVLRDRFPLLPDRSASLDAHDPPALPCSRSRNVFVGCRVALPTPCPSCDVHVPGRSPRSTSTHLFSHISIDTAAFRLQHRGCRDLPVPAPRDARHLSAPTIPQCRAPLELQHLSASDLARCSLNTLTARVHIQRIVIEKVGSFVSDQAALLELSRLPTRPPRLRSPRLSPLPPPSRKISSVRLAALPFR